MEIGKVETNQPLPGWRSFASRATIISVLEKQSGPNSDKTPEERKLFEICFVPKDWVGIRPDPTGKRRRPDGPYFFGGKVKFSGDLKGCFFRNAKALNKQFPSELQKKLFPEECSLKSDVSLARADKTFAGKQQELDTEIARLMADVLPGQRDSALFSLVELGIPARKLFAENRGMPSTYARAEMFRLLLRLGTATPTIIHEGLSDANSHVQGSVINGLKRLPYESRLQYFATLVDTAKSTNASVRQITATTLGSFPQEQSQPLLISLLKDNEWQVQYSALESLCELKSKGYGKELVAVLNSKNWVLRKRVLEVMSELNDPDLVSPLLEFALKRGVTEIGKKLGVETMDATTDSWGAIKSAYRLTSLKGDVKDGMRLTILVVKKRFAVNEPIHVFHVAETVQPGTMLLLAGPLPAQDFIDGRPAGVKVQMGVYDGRVTKKPAIAVNYEVTTHHFSEAGRHSIQWVESERVSNTIEIEVVEKR